MTNQIAVAGRASPAVETEVETFARLYDKHTHALFNYCLSILRPDNGLPLQTLVGEGSFIEIEISGQPAVLVKGGWDSASRAWAHPDVTTILWAGDGVRYSLVSSDPKVSPEDLVEIAASAD